MATPQQVRKELLKRNLPFKIAKGGKTWYVYDGDAAAWETSTLCTWTLNGFTAQQWVDIIVDMDKCHKEKNYL